MPELVPLVRVTRKWCLLMACKGRGDAKLELC